MWWMYITSFGVGFIIGYFFDTPLSHKRKHNGR